MTSKPKPRQTRQRAEILSALATAGDFRSAQQWHDVLRHESSTVGLATVYRALQSLAESGEVDAVVTDSGETLYRRCEAGDEHHHHLRCRRCGAAEEIDVPDFEAWATQLAATHGYSSIDHTVEITGLCGECAKATN
ncbi:Fur family transcriptional regulator [Demequina aurantiaca]|uniref:Fur family transcriptional regulator n=1 Tax=Demequina aurantiaca TaxID=676200 RepID=UPI0007805F29|nr:transcriptional repressor [Demequina aurantiaca]